MEDILAKSGEASDFLKLLANPNRLAVLCCLIEKKCNVTESSQKIGIPQAAMSNQLTILRESSAIDCEIRHRERLYYIKDERVYQIIDLLHSFFC